jgi:hypothetical protein
MAIEAPALPAANHVVLPGIAVACVEEMAFECCHIVRMDASGLRPSRSRYRRTPCEVAPSLALACSCHLHKCDL